MSKLKDQFDKLKISCKIHGSCEGIARYLVELLLSPRWVVIHSKDGDDLGFKIGPFIFPYYKWPDPAIGLARNHDYRVMKKREFGESIHPRRSTDEQH